MPNSKMPDGYPMYVARLRQIFGGDEVKDVAGPILLRQLWPGLVEHLMLLLIEFAEGSFASTISELQVFDRCRCGQQDCGTVYTKPRPSTSAEALNNPGCGPQRRAIMFCLDTGQNVGSRMVRQVPHTIILDIVDDEIVCIEIIGDGESVNDALDKT